MTGARSRLLATARLDTQLQLRNGFYYAVAFFLACWFVVLTQLPAVVDWGFVLPAVILGNLSMVSFYFIGGLVLLEKGEGTLHAQVVTPLGDREYLASKIVTLAALSLVEHVVLVGSVLGWDVNPLALVAGVSVASVLYSLCGFLSVARYDSINEYLLPSALYVAVLQIPLIHYFGIWDGWPMYLHPMQAPLVLIRGAFQPLAAWEWIYGVVYSGLALGVLFWWCQRAFGRFVVAAEGV